MNFTEILEDTSANKKESLPLRIFPQNNSSAKVIHFKVKEKKTSLNIFFFFFFKKEINGPSQKCCFKEKDQIISKSFQDTGNKVEKVYLLEKAETLLLLKSVCELLPSKGARALASGIRVVIERRHNAAPERKDVKNIFYFLS